MLPVPVSTSTSATPADQAMRCQVVSWMWAPLPMIGLPANEITSAIGTFLVGSALVDDHAARNVQVLGAWS